MEEMLIYTGIGSRNTPTDIQVKMTILAGILAQHDWVLRSGGANGADIAFEIGCTTNNGKKEIYLPWSDFNGNKSDLFGIDETALELANKYHSGWNYLTAGAKALMARNGYQVLGYDLNTPTDCVICWTPDGLEHHKNRSKKSGGTGQAISIASDMGIPVFNLKNPNTIHKLNDFLHQNGVSYEMEGSYDMSKLFGE